MDTGDPIHHDGLLHVLALPIVDVVDTDGPLAVPIPNQLTLQERSLIHLGGPAIREDEDLRILIALLDPLVDQEAIIGLVDLRQEQ